MFRSSSTPWFLTKNSLQAISRQAAFTRKMVLHILAAISQYEAELVATRTKQALAAKKAQGYTLGNPEHLMDKLDEAVAKSVETNKRKAEENPNNKRAAAMLKVLAKEGYKKRKGEVI